MELQKSIRISYESQQDADLIMSILIAGAMTLAMHNRKNLRCLERAVLSPRSVTNARPHLSQELNDLLTHAIEIDDILDLIPDKSTEKINLILARALESANRAAAGSHNVEGVFFDTR